MNRMNFGRISGILVNICIDHGTWFDGGGLALALEFVATGRLEEVLAEERQELEAAMRDFTAWRGEDPRAQDEDLLEP